ncbi:hypothetical protein QQF64_012581 [Cirrhinus molitorella]|uniref:Uncharacterized protein n=1 Tax=Cirrhinus molitorella TaxID=172907 RepID=A0ABR3LYF5_9TELE
MSVTEVSAVFLHPRYPSKSVHPQPKQCPTWFSCCSIPHSCLLTSALPSHEELMSSHSLLTSTPVLLSGFCAP